MIRKNGTYFQYLRDQTNILLRKKDAQLYLAVAIVFSALFIWFSGWQDFKYYFAVVVILASTLGLLMKLYTLIFTKKLFIHEWITSIILVIISIGLTFLIQDVETAVSILVRMTLSAFAIFLVITIFSALKFG